MKNILVLLILGWSAQGFCQTTHSVLVNVNQGTGCSVLVNTKDPILQESQLFKVFPNPVQSSLTIQSELLQSRIRLFDAQGREVRSGTLQSKEMIMDVQGLKSGIYVLYFEHKTGSDHIKIKVL